MIASLVLLSLASFIAVIVGTYSGAFSSGRIDGFWTTVVMIPWFALPLAMILTITLLIISAVTRARNNKSSN